MTSTAATKAVLLKVLIRHLKGESHEHEEITIDEAKYEIVSSDLDFLVKDTSSSLLTARVILTLRDLSRPNGEGVQSTTELAVHITTTTSPDASSPSTSVILEDASQANGEAPPATPPHRASTIPTHPLTDKSTNSSRRPLADTYREYISTFMSDPPATALASLPQFLHQPVTHNRRAIGVEEYHSLIQEARRGIPDIACEIVDLIADEERQVVAARLEFRGTLVRPFAGAEPPPAGGGLPVRIGEIVFYWFDEGRLREVVSLVDTKGLRDLAQNQAQA